MKKFQKRMLALALSLVMVFGMTITTAAAPYVSTKITYYLSASTYNALSYDMYVGNLKSSSKITSVKSSKPALLKYTGYTKYFRTEGSDYFPASGSSSETPSRNKQYYAYMNVQMGIGSASLSYKIDKNSYKTSFKVYKYANPIKSIKIKGVNSDKSFASSFKERNSASFELKKSISNATVVVTPASGWKITKISYSCYDSTSSSSSSNSRSSYGTVTYKTPRSSQTSYKMSTFKKGQYSYVYIYLENTKTGGTQTCTIYLK